MSVNAPGETGKRAAAVLALLSLIALPPTMLIWAAGWPVPTRSQLSTAADLHWVPPELARELAASAGWLLWLYVAGCLATAIVGQLRGISAHLPAPRLVATPLKGLVAVALVGVTMTTRAAVASPAPAVLHVTAASTVAGAMTQSREAPRTCVVHPRDTLWDIAERELGDPMRWRELWTLNSHHVMADGVAFSNPDLIQPGWVLTLPAEKAHARPPSPVHKNAPARVVEVPSPVVPAPPPTEALALPTARAVSPPAEGHAQREQSSVPLGVGLGLGAGAVGVVGALVAARRRRLHRRPSGLRPPLPTGRMAEAELALRDRGVAVEAEQVAGALRLARALSVGAELVVERVDVVPAGVTVTFGSEHEPPSPFSACGPRVWMLPVEDVGAVLAAWDHIDPAPALIGLGDGVYINLESSRSLALIEASEEQLSGLVTALAYAPWAGMTDVMCLIGSLAIVDPESRVALSPDDLASVTPRVRRVIDELIACQLASLGATRWSDANEPADGVTVVVLKADDPAAQHALMLANDPRSPVVALVLGDNPAAAHRWPADVDRSVSLPAVTEEVVTTTEELFSLTEEPFVTPEAEPYASLPTAAAQVLEAHEVVVGVLGPLEVTGDVAHMKPQLIEIMVYLALHERPVSVEEMAAALWPDDLRSDKSLRNRIYELRKALAGRLSSGRGWTLDETVTTDWAQFRTLAKGELQEQQQALRLVRGQVLHQVRGDWAGLEGFESEMTARIVDVALDVSEKLLAAGDPVAATEAARAGLKACPWEERLYVVAMQAAADRGAIGEVTSLYREMTGVLDLEIDAEPEPESRAMYEALLREARRASALGPAPAVEV